MEREALNKLVEEATKGSLKAFERIYNLFVEGIYKYIYFKVGNPFDAEELTGQVFLKAFEKIKDYQITEKPFTAWLYKIAHNVVIDLFRERRKYILDEFEKAESIKEAKVEPEEIVVNNLTLESLYEALMNLTEEQREVIILRFIERLTASEVAKIMGKTEGGVRALQRRGLATLSRIFNSYAKLENLL